MKKQIILLGTLLFSVLTFSQVGINTETPKSTLDVVGKATDTSSLDGITAPRLTGNQLRAKTYTTDQTGTLVYITAADSAPAGQTVNVTSAGYYYFDGTLWQTVKSSSVSTNIYTANGSLTSTRTLALSGYQLNFNGTDRTTYWDTAGRIHQRAINPSSDAAMGFHGGSANLWMQQWPNASSSITATGTSSSLDLATHFTAASAPITLSTSPGGNTTSVERVRITGEGNVGVNSSDPTERFDNNGITRLRILPLNGTTNAINTTSTGDASATQDQTFTATRTVVADANGVLGTVAGLPATPVNIYNANGTLTSDRTLTQSGFGLTFLGSNQYTSFPSSGGIRQYGTAGSKRADMVLTANDNNGDAVNSIMSFYQDPEGTGQIVVLNDSRGLTLSSRFTTQSAPIKFETSAGGGANSTEKMRITGEGNVGMNVANPTEKLDNNGITRLRNLPANGTANAINTTPGGAASASQDQTFNATRTVVADANGVLGTVAGIPSDAGTSRVLVIANAPGTQNVKAQSGSNAAIGQFTNESLDVYNAWTNNIFTVPANMGGVYIIVMQNSSTHTSTGSPTPTWHTMAFYEKSTDGGTNWVTMLKDTYSNLAGTIVDNGNTLYWTGFLNAGDQIRVRFGCNADTDNIVNYGGLSITKLAQ
ncbi:hypothetical protein ACFQO9_04995 [Chryseobacterium zhengzhouense]|uniref:Uncharacterized protein n=1 Tax=Chryseobacterium zhengzhouense TaxID=1636086 RepID=A0ABW2LWP9_9FLAO